MTHRRAAGVLALVALAGMHVAHGQASSSSETDNPPPQPQPGRKPGQSETDIGRVSTGPGQGERVQQVTPSATTDRAAAIDEKNRRRTSSTCSR